jgi:uncharacterized membrane protein AbrB (regulator of aidB expression)
VVGQHNSAPQKRPTAITDLAQLLVNQFAKAAMPWAFGTAVALLGMAVLMAFLITRFSGISLTTTLFSLAPGGIGSMGVMAQAEGGKAAVVGLFHTVRVILTFLLIPILNRWFHR